MGEASPGGPKEGNEPQSFPHITHKLTLYEEARLLLLRAGNKKLRRDGERGFACVVGALFRTTIVPAWLVAHRAHPKYHTPSGSLITLRVGG